MIEIPAEWIDEIEQAPERVRITPKVFNQIKEFVSRYYQVRSLTAISESTGYSRTVIDRAVKELMREGKIEKD